MVKSKKKSARDLSGQTNFLDKPLPADPGSLNISLRLREAISQALRRCKLSRSQVAAQMSKLTGNDISKTMLDAYTSASEEYHRFPAEWIPALVLVTGNEDVLRVLTEFTITTKSLFKERAGLSPPALSASTARGG